MFGFESSINGYQGATFDGRFVYFVPYHTGGTQGEILRYDTTSEFKSINSWSIFNASTGIGFKIIDSSLYQIGTHGVGVDPVGFEGAVFDGRYVYFVPHTREGGNHGEVLRYDTTDNFQSGNSWSTFDPGANGVGNDPDGYVMGVFDGRYIYFAPYHNGNEHHGEVLRYDTTSNFESPYSWSTFDASASGIGVNPVGYEGVVFDGRYVYFLSLIHI